MPKELKDTIVARQIVKSHEKRMNYELRKLAEEEILKEAEKFYKED